MTSRSPIARRLRRFGFFLLLGYALHFPMAKLVHLYGMSEEPGALACGSSSGPA